MSVNIVKAKIAVQNEINQINNHNKKQKTIIDHYEFVKQLADFYFYKIWVADDLKLQEDEQIIINAANNKIDAIVISIHETQDIVIRTKVKLTEEIYYLNRQFNPAFILKALNSVLDQAHLNNSELLAKLEDKICDDKEIIIDNDIPWMEDLNEAQKKAITLAEEKEFALIWGPPGTGKTHTISQIIYRAFLRNERVLVLSTSNVAVDQVIIHLNKLVSKAQKPFIARLGYTDNEICITYTKDNDKENFSLSNKSVVFSTLATLVLKYSKIANESFDVIILDESSMISMPYVFVAATQAKRNIIFAGDFQQLPPIALTEGNLLSENIFTYFDVPSIIEKGGLVSYLALLDTQYRMRKNISDLISSLFYKDLLKCGLADSTKGELEFIDIDDSNYCDSYFSVEYSSYYNPITLLILEKKLQIHFSESSDILFITPYRAQQSIISYYFLDKGYKNGRSLTVHKSQGAEADIVVFDLTTHVKTSKTEYAKILTSNHTHNLLNVAMSRAKKKLIIIGSLRMFSEFSKSSPFWRKFYNKAKTDFKIANLSSLLSKPQNFSIKNLDEKIVVGIDKRGTQEFLDYFKRSKAEKKIYFSPIELPIEAGITFRRLPDYSVPELLMWGKEIAFRENHGHYGFHLGMSTEVLRRVSIGHMVDTAEQGKNNTYSLHCEHCQGNKVVVWNNYAYKLQCSECQRVTNLTMLH